LRFDGNRCAAIGFAQEVALLDVWTGTSVDGNDSAADSAFFSRRTFGSVY